MILFADNWVSDKKLSCRREARQHSMSLKHWQVWQSFGIPRKDRAAIWPDSLSICFSVFIHYQTVTDRQTDIMTTARTVLCNASCGTIFGSTVRTEFL